MNKVISLRIFLVLIATYAILAGISVFLPQGSTALPGPQPQMPAPLLLMALAAGGSVLVVYGALGLVGLLLARKLALPEIWDAGVSNRQRFLVPALAGAAIGVVLILGDLLFSPVNGIGQLQHPPFPTSIVASLAAGIGEEIVFRLFFISFWTWFISRILARGHAQTPIYWVVAALSAIAAGLVHLPAVMYLENWTDPSQVPLLLIIQLIALNGLISMIGAWLFKKYGLLATVGVHFWADVVWHVIWGVV